MGVVKVTAAECPQCEDWIYSRAPHDCHSCSCGAITVDGGFDYLRVLWKQDVCGNSAPPTRFVEVDATRQQLFHDWSLGSRSYGWIHPAEAVEGDIRPMLGQE